MSFLSPLFLVGMVAAAVPILLHFLRRQPEVSVTFPAMRLLQHAPVEQTSRRRLRDLLLLALRVGALVLLSLAFARPFLAGATAMEGGVTIVALDTSLSLGAPGRMAAAQALARQAIERAPSAHLVGVVTFADAPVVVATPSSDRGFAVSAVNSAEAGAGGTRYRAALEAATGLIASHGDGTGTIVMVTDLQAGGWDQDDRVLLPGPVALEIADVGPLPDNLSLIAARAEGPRVLTTVANFGQAPREARVSISTDGQPLGELTLAVGAGQSVDAAFSNITADRMSVQVVDPEGLQSDNTRFLLAGQDAPPVVLVVTTSGDLDRDAFYVQQALAARGPAGATFTVEGVAASALSSRDAAALEPVAAIVMLSTRGLERRGRELLSSYLQQGGGVLLAAGPGIDAEVAAGIVQLDQPLVIPGAAAPRDPRGAGRALIALDTRHPVFQRTGASFGGATFQRVAAVGSADCQTVARFTTGESAMLDCVRGEGRALVFASDLNHSWNDLPRYAAFLPFLHESVRYLWGGRAGWNELTVGQTPAAVVPGIVSLPGPTGEARLVAVNFDPRESAPARLTPEAFQGAITRVPAAPPAGAIEALQQEDRQHIWRYALLAMIVMLIAESALASRAA